MLQPAHRYLVRLVVTLSVCLAAGVCYADLMVDATVQTLGGGLFHYEYAIANNLPGDDVAIVSIVDAPTSDANITNTLAAPTGFTASYDSGLGIVTFLEDTSLFAIGTTVSGFSFDSAFGPATGLFSLCDGLDENGQGVSCTLQTQVIPQVPEPGALALLTLGLAALAVSLIYKQTRLCER